MFEITVILLVASDWKIWKETKTEFSKLSALATVFKNKMFCNTLLKFYLPILLEKTARRELNKNAACCFEEILEAALHKTAVVQPLTSHLINHPNEMSKTCWVLLGKRVQTHKQHSPTHYCWPTLNTCIHQLCKNIECSLKDLPNRDGWRKRVKRIYPVGMASCWWVLENINLELSKFSVLASVFFLNVLKLLT